jgi:hypothetical protein
VPTARYHLAYEELAAGDILFFYTDGLIERRDRGIDEGIAALLTAARGRWGETADEAVEALLDHLDPPTAEDDICVLAIRVRLLSQATAAVTANFLPRIPADAISALFLINVTSVSTGEPTQHLCWSEPIR